jgi:hypothetical protein
MIQENRFEAQDRADLGFASPTEQSGENQDYIIGTIARCRRNHVIGDFIPSHFQDSEKDLLASGFMKTYCSVCATSRTPDSEELKIDRNFRMTTTG